MSQGLDNVAPEMRRSPSKTLFLWNVLHQLHSDRLSMAFLDFYAHALEWHEACSRVKYTYRLTAPPLPERSGEPII
jgi:hypothetical protein